MDQKGSFSEPERDPMARPVLDTVLVTLGPVMAPVWDPFWDSFWNRKVRKNRPKRQEEKNVLERRKRGLDIAGARREALGMVS